MNFAQMGALLLKTIVTGALLYFLYTQIDLAPVIDRLSSIHPVWALAAVCLLMVQLVLTGIRWFLVNRIIGSGVHIFLAIRLILIGQFFNQVLPSSVGGDGVRAWLLSRGGYSIRHAIASVICDRASALVMLATVVSITFPLALLTGEANVPYATQTAVLIGGSTMLGFVVLGVYGHALSTRLQKIPAVRSIGIIIANLRTILLESDKSVEIIFLSIVVQLVLVASISFCAVALGVALTTVHMLLLPMIMLVSSIPISLAGWGVRESAMVAGLGFAGVAAGDALVVSVCFGLGQVLIGLPGAIIALRSNYWKAQNL